MVGVADEAITGHFPSLLATVWQYREGGAPQVLEAFTSFPKAQFSKPGMQALGFSPSS